MPTEAEILEDIRNHFPLVFQSSQAANPPELQDAYTELFEYAIVASQPILSSETTRYQTILFHWAIFLVALQALHLGKIKILDSVLDVDRRLLLLLCVFIGAIALIFGIKAYVDYQRSTFAREKNAPVIASVQQWAEQQGWKRAIQIQLWVEVFNLIGRAYSLSDAERDLGYERVSFGQFDLTGFVHLDTMRKNPSLRPDIEALEEYVAELKSALGRDEQRFRDRVEAIRAIRSAGQEHTLDRLQVAYEDTLGSWVEARRALSLEQLDIAIEKSPERVRLDAVLHVLRRTSRVRYIYWLLEVAVPLTLAGLAAVWTYLSPSIR